MENDSRMEEFPLGYLEKACKLCRPGEQFFPLSEFCYIKVLESWTKNNLEPSLVHQTSKKTNHSTSLHRMERGKKRKRKYYLLSHRKKGKSEHFSWALSSQRRRRGISIFSDDFYVFEMFFHLCICLNLRPRCSLSLCVWCLRKKETEDFPKQRNNEFSHCDTCWCCCAAGSKATSEAEKFFFCVQLWNLAGDMLCMLSVGGRDEERCQSRVSVISCVSEFPFFGERKTPTMSMKTQFSFLPCHRLNASVRKQMNKTFQWRRQQR